MKELPPHPVTQVDVLVKPGAEAQFTPGLYKTPSYKDLIDAWEARIQQLEVSENTLLLYFSELGDSQVERNATTQYSSKWEKLEYKRIQQLHERLSWKIVVLGTSDYPYREQVLKSIRGNNVEWDPSTVSVWAYGEHIEPGVEWCVASWGKLVKGYLGARDENYTFPIPELSMSVERALKAYQEYKALGWRRPFVKFPTKKFGF